jgi:hypothetical protein
MGQIDSEKMYTNVMKWDWGNSDSDKIYIMIQTRREYHLQNKSCPINGSIDSWKKVWKGKTIIDLALTKCH